MLPDTLSILGNLVVSSCLVFVGVTMVLAGSVVVVTCVGTFWLCLHSCKLCLARYFNTYTTQPSVPDVGRNYFKN